MDTATHITHLAEEAQRFAAATERAGLDALVPSCPGWDVRELLRHLSEIHLWAAAHVACRATKMWVDDLEELAVSWPELAVFWPDDDDLVDFYRATNANLVHELRTASPDVAAMTFLPAPSPLAMWARRQCHEVTVHRIDAEQAADEVTDVDPALAADGIDEIVMAFAPRATTLPVDRTRTMAVHATDVDAAWSVTMGPDGISAARRDASTDATISGVAVDIYRSLWNRGDGGVTVTGDPDVLAAWHANHRVRWS